MKMKRNYLKNDFISGFLVFLIALPLCLGIAAASGFPPIAGVITAIVGGVLSSILGSSPLTIKGPAAGMIVIVLAAVQELGAGDKILGYKRTLAACVLAAAFQILTSLFKGASFTQIIPTSVIHGMLSAIGVIIIFKQIPVLLGAAAFKATPLEFFFKIPELIHSSSKEEAIIGLAGLAVMFGFGYLAIGFLKKVPPQLFVLSIGMLLASLEHLNPFSNPDIWKFFVQVPDKTLSLVTFPDFSMVFSPLSLKHSIFIFLVASIESLLTVNAIDSIDPEKRVSNLNKDLFSCGIGNMVASLIGGLPMISEIVRSRANIDNGAKSAQSNFFHGIFLLLAVLLVPHLLDRIPLACLAAMLIYTGTRLASVKEFKHAFHSGGVHFTAFMLTLILTVISDLLTGVIVGFLFETAVSFYRSEKKINLFKADLQFEESSNRVAIHVKDSLHFINFFGLHKQVNTYLKKGSQVHIDFSRSSYVDSTAREKLRDLVQKSQKVELKSLVVHS
jgi:MFS superfamily sulfate permease-like transporter